MVRMSLVRLAHEWDGRALGGWLMSEKLDGMRAFWRPETRGMRFQEVPWAKRDKDSRDHVCTGLWSRQGKVIFCPWDLGDKPLDGELWLGRGGFQAVMSICKTLSPGPGWKEVKYCVFEPLVSPQGPILPVKQEVLPLVGWEERLTERLEEVTNEGGEGLIVRHPTMPWKPGRDWGLLKVKKLRDSEGIVVGWKPGLGKFDGMMGSLTIDWHGTIFDLSGFTDQERQLVEGWPVAFPRGTEVRFRYRELSDDGVPKFASFWR